MRAHINAEIGGLVEVAIDACGATGQTPFEEALRALGGKVRFEPGMLARLFDESPEPAFPGAHVHLKDMSA